MWDYEYFGEWRRYTGDKRTVFDGVRLAWCETCIRISRKSVRRFVQPTKEALAKILEKSGKNPVKEEYEDQAGAIHVGPDEAVHRLPANAQV